MQFRLLLCFLLLGVSLQAQPTDINSEIEYITDNLLRNIQINGEEKVSYSLEDRMDYYKVPGLSIAVIENGELRWAKGYGYANTNTGSNVDENTMFQAGSISKPVAALAVMKLYEEGKVDLDKDVNAYLKDWKIPESTYTSDKKVTLRLLLTHSAGTTIHGFPGYQQKDKFPSITDVLDGKGNTPKIVLDTIPNSMWRYSGGGYTIMEKVVEDVTQLGLEAYMEASFFKPLQMARSTYDQPIDVSEYDNISAAYDGGGMLVEGLWNNYPEQAAAGLWTTPSDLAKYIISLQKGFGGKDDVLKASTIKTMLTKHTNDWGLGPSLAKEKDSLVFKHGGKNNGFTNNMVAYAGLGKGVIVMTSADRGNGLINEIMMAISSYYNWNLMNPTYVSKIELSAAELSSFEADYVLDYQVPGIGDYNAEVKLVDGMLKVFDKVEQQTFNLIPIGEHLFLDIELGYKFEFKPEENSLEVNNQFRFIKK